MRTQADEVLKLLGDPKRCQVVLVTLPEATPVNEVVETAYALEERVGVQLGPVVVNGVDVVGHLPDGSSDDVLARAVKAGTIDDVTAAALGDAARFRRSRTSMQRGEIERLAGLLALPQVHLPFLPVAGVDESGVRTLVHQLTGEVVA